MGTTEQTDTAGLRKQEECKASMHCRSEEGEALHRFVPVEIYFCEGTVFYFSHNA
ncbi:hypothetical protein [Vagococcus sp. WN89Y]|uniref:hypothetical protein n=1 Tax=Vagococcus sp. WN89Y TaxID=3457258 RepID=UPI003FCE4FDA